MASSPRYDPSVYAGHVTGEELARAGPDAEDGAAKNYPSLDRAIAGVYPPGSTFKPVTALAAMQEHLLVAVRVPAVHRHVHVAAGPLAPHVPQLGPERQPGDGPPTALAYSCDTYFYQLGNEFYNLPARPRTAAAEVGERVRLRRADRHRRRAGGGGLVPTIGWRTEALHDARVDKLWKPGDSIQLAIGQGDLLVTPLQMARFYALLANGGKLVTPHVLMDVESPNGAAVPVPAAPAPKAGAASTPLRSRSCRRDSGRRRTCSFGTSYAVFGNFPVSIAGKTGTAEKVVSLPGYAGLQNQSWWCGYGPSNTRSSSCAP